MFKATFGHVRRQPVAYIALFFALGGGAMAASDVIHAGTPAGGALSGTYPNPSLGVTGGDNGSTACKSGEALTSLSSAAVIGCAATTGTPTGNAGGDLTGTYPNPTIATGAVTTGKLADGSVTTGKFASGAQAPDSAELAGAGPTAYGAVLSGRVNGLPAEADGTHYGAVSGISSAVGLGSESEVSTLSPAHDLVARDLTVQLTAAPGNGVTRQFTIDINGDPVVNHQFIICNVTDTATTCNPSGTVAVAAGSTIAIHEETICLGPTNCTGNAAAADARFGFRLTDS